MPVLSINEEKVKKLQAIDIVSADRSQDTK
jgi:hypothetical protein